LSLAFRTITTTSGARNAPPRPNHTHQCLAPEPDFLDPDSRGRFVARHAR
jgi:hypothetical protein